MMNDRYTPGPWRVHGDTRAVVADAPTGHDDEGNMREYGGHLVAESVEWESNRLAICAVPELIEALRNLIAVLPKSAPLVERVGPALEQARAALNKAGVR